MAHEVVKRVGSRAYRYRVESFRDPETRKVRSRWTYVGIAVLDMPPATEPAADPAAPPYKARPTRERLVEAFIALTEEHTYAAITAGMVATRAGLAHGTFYRYFSDKRAVFFAALERVREEFDREGPSLETPLGDREAERARLRAWATLKLGKPGRYVGMRRAFFEGLEGDPELRQRRLARRADRSEAFVRYLERLVAAGIATIGDCAALGSALMALVDGAMRDVLGYGLESATVDGVAEVFDRAIFMASAGSVSATEMRDLSSISKYPT